MDVSRRARFIEHNGKRLYLIDAEGLGADGVVALAAQVARDVRAQPLGSVLTITNAKNVVADMKLIEALRALTDGNRPHVKAAAVTGLSGMHRMVFNTLKVLARRDFHVFETVDEAKEFLSKLE